MVGLGYVGGGVGVSGKVNEMAARHSCNLKYL